MRFCEYGYDNEYICDFGMVLALEVAAGLILQDCWICFSREKMIEFSLSMPKSPFDMILSLYLSQ